MAEGVAEYWSGAKDPWEAVTAATSLFPLSKYHSLPFIPCFAPGEPLHVTKLCFRVTNVFCKVHSQGYVEYLHGCEKGSNMGKH